MPKGPQGQKRPADVVGCAVHVAKIATGEIEETASATSRQPNKAKGGARGRPGTRRSAGAKTVQRNCPCSGEDSMELNMFGARSAPTPSRAISVSSSAV